MNKLQRLKGILKDMGSVVVAYSGGMDSTFLLKVARDVLQDQVLAVTADSATYPAEELVFAKRMARELGAKHKIIRTRELKNEKFIRNPVNRCYFCKRELFSALKDIARKNKLNFVVDASNTSDLTDFRPGSIAKKELKVRSPLEEAGFSKEDLRKTSKKLGLPTADKPALACLASRIPYGTKITLPVLSRINRAENFLRKSGFRQVRLRHYGRLARIEVGREEVNKLVKKSKSHKVTGYLNKIGYDQVAVDLKGYRMGSMNEGIKK